MTVKKRFLIVNLFLLPRHLGSQGPSSEDLPVVVFCFWRRRGEGVLFSLSLAGNSGGLAWERHNSRKSSGIHFYKCVSYFRVSKQWPCGHHGLGFLTCAHMLMNAIAHGGCTVTVRVCTGS